MKRALLWFGWWVQKWGTGATFVVTNEVFTRTLQGACYYLSNDSSETNFLKLVTDVTCNKNFDRSKSIAECTDDAKANTVKKRKILCTPPICFFSLIPLAYSVSPGYI